MLMFLRVWSASVRLLYVQCTIVWCCILTGLRICYSVSSLVCKCQGKSNLFRCLCVFWTVWVLFCLWFCMQYCTLFFLICWLFFQCGYWYTHCCFGVVLDWICCFFVRVACFGFYVGVTFCYIFLFLLHNIYFIIIIFIFMIIIILY